MYTAIAEVLLSGMLYVQYVVYVPVQGHISVLACTLFFRLTFSRYSHNL